VVQDFASEKLHKVASSLCTWYIHRCSWTLSDLRKLNSIIDVTHLSIKRLKAADIHCLIFDADNTLVAPYKKTLHDRLSSHWPLLRTHFDCYILSNSAGTNDDTDQRQARLLSASLHVPVIRHIIKKPLGQAQIQRQLAQQYKPEQMALIGDRTTTDIAFGNIAGMFTVRVQPLVPKSSEIPGLQGFRKMEQKLEAALLNRGYCPPSHPALEKYLRNSA
jgi:phosphatidylglycerophosphatase GEP4